MLVRFSSCAAKFEIKVDGNFYTRLLCNRVRGLQQENYFHISLRLTAIFLRSTLEPKTLTSPIIVLNNSI